MLMGYNNIMSKKVIKLFLALLLLCSYAATRQAIATGLEGSIETMADYCSPTSDPNLCQFAGNSLGSSMASLSFQILGGVDSNGLAVVQDSMVGDISSGMAFMIQNKPADTATYVADVLHNNFGVAQPAYAQDSRGIGFVGLQPVLAIWKGFRNVTYLAFVLVMIIAGFLIMFRAKLGAQTAVTIQAALPRVVVTMILITFSYAIAGLMVDLIYFLIFFIAGAFELGGLLLQGTGRAAAEALLGKSIFGIGFQYFVGMGEAAGRVAYGISLIVREIITSAGLPGVGGQFLSSIVGYLIAAIAILIAIVRTFFALLKAYISLILNVVTAPLQILPNAFPNSNAFMTWLKKIAADAMVFPAVAAMILLGIIMMGYTATGTNDMDIEVNPEVGFNRNWGSSFNNAGGPADPGGFTPPFVLPGNSGTADVLQALIGFGIIMLLPEVVNMVKAAFGVQEDKLGALAMQNFKSGSSPITVPMGIVGGFALQAGVNEAAKRVAANPQILNKLAFWRRTPDVTSGGMREVDTKFTSRYEQRRRLREGQRAGFGGPSARTGGGGGVNLDEASDE